MLKIKRKVVLHGRSTLTVSLPSIWLKKLKISKGDELEVREYGNEIRISRENGMYLGKKSININNLARL